MKDLGWAECLQSCSAGLHYNEAKEYQTPWNCLQVGSPAARVDPPPPPCGQLYGPCLESRCCQDGLGCFLQDANWAQCRHNCVVQQMGMIAVSGNKVPQPWSCARLRPGKAAPAPAPPAVPDAASCAGVAQDCRQSRCCKDDFMGCYERDEGWAGCLRDCQAGPGWSCKLLGPPRHGGLSDGRSIFCFAVMLPFGGEVALLKSQFQNQVGIFRCDRHRVFSNTSMQLGSPGLGLQESTVVVPGSMVCHPGGIYYTALNTEIFVRFWKTVLQDKNVQETDWTVKADPDAVFLPSRLRDHVKRYLDLKSTHSGHPVYLNNCKDGLHGPLEVISRGGMTALAGGIGLCESELQHEYKLYGEDVFLRHCMLILGVDKFDDFSLLYETVCDPFPKDPMPCTPMKVAYHPLKAPSRYMECLAQAESQEKANVAGAKLLQVGV